MARALLLRGSVFVHLDPRAEGVVLPKHLTQQPQVMLQIGLDLPIPIPDLRVDGQGLSGTLSFNRSPFHCAIPWPAVFALAGEEGRGMIWEDAMPSELTAEVERELGKRPPQGLRVLEGGGERPDTIPPPPSSVAAELAADDDARDRAAGSRKPPEGGDKRHGHLRVVK